MIRLDIVRDILSLNFRYVVIKTKYTTHHIEKTTYRDRGRIKWIAETNPDAFDYMNDCKEAQQSHIDGGDLFPRLYFLPTSFQDEFDAWLAARGLKIVSMEHGEI